MDPPCDQCPKGGPENEKRHTLSVRNCHAYSLWLKIKASHGAYRIHPKIAQSPIFGQVMWLVSKTVKNANQEWKTNAIIAAQKRAALDKP